MNIPRKMRKVIYSKPENSLNIIVVLSDINKLNHPFQISDLKRLIEKNIEIYQRFSIT